jgi:hypothetical protein
MRLCLQSVRNEIAFGKSLSKTRRRLFLVWIGALNVVLFAN